MNRTIGSGLVAGMACLVLTGGLLAGPGGGVSGASSHVDAISTILDPQMDACNLYAFTSPERPDTVTLAATYIPFQIPGIPYPWSTDEARYEIHVDTTGDGKQELSYRFTFHNDDGGQAPKLPPSQGYATHPGLGAFSGPGGYPDSDSEARKGSGDRVKAAAARSKRVFVNQHYTLEEVRPGQPPKTLVKSGTNVAGTVETLGSAFGYENAMKKAIVSLPNGTKISVGQAKDPFYFDARIFGLSRTGIPFIPPVDIFAPFNVSYFAIQIPKKELALKGDPNRNPVIGVWTTSARKNLNLLGGPETYQQNSRYGNIFVDTVARNLGDRFNRDTAPDQDHTDKYLLSQVRDPVFAQYMQPGTLTLAPPRPRRDLEEIFMTGITKATNGPMGNIAPIKEDLNSQLMNQDADPSKVVLAEELRLNMSTPVSAKPGQYGYIDGDRQGWPNGQRLIDDNETIQVRMVMGQTKFNSYKTFSLLSLTTATISSSPKPPSSTFPYFRPPDVRF